MKTLGFNTKTLLISIFFITFGLMFNFTYAVIKEICVDARDDTDERLTATTNGLACVSRSETLGNFFGINCTSTFVKPDGDRFKCVERSPECLIPNNFIILNGMKNITCKRSHIKRTGSISTADGTLTLNPTASLYTANSNTITKITAIKYIADGTSFPPFGYYLTSDKRLKKNINKINNPLKLLQNLNGYRYTWKDSGKKNLGVIAQEVERVLPELVDINTDGIKSVNYDALIPILIESVKELDIEINKLQ